LLSLLIFKKVEQKMFHYLIAKYCIVNFVI